MNSFLVELERINPERIVFVFPLSHIGEIHFPQIDFTMVCSTYDKAFGVDGEGVDVLVFGTNSEVFWSKLVHIDF